MADTFNILDGRSLTERFYVEGRQPSAGGSTEDVWPVGGNYPFSAVDAACQLLSDNAADTNAGTGAQRVVVTGLSGGLITSETVTPNGVTPVALSNQYSRIFRTEISQAGSSGSNVGTITIQQTSGPVVLGQIDPGLGNVLNGIFTVPDNWDSAIVKGTDIVTSALTLLIQFRRPTTGGWTNLFTYDAAEIDLQEEFLLPNLTREPELFTGYDLRIRIANILSVGQAVSAGLTVERGT